MKKAQATSLAVFKLRRSGLSSQDWFLMQHVHTSASVQESLAAKWLKTTPPPTLFAGYHPIRCFSFLELADLLLPQDSFKTSP
jgi:hypothetical protein